ncbi:MAG: hypothetical protein GXO83_11440 [Chlorobi bacterium]|nr:hypothetical protein [Chlorobiota bacterium]
MKSLDGGRTWNFMDFAPTGVNSIGFTDNGELVVFGGRDYYSGSCSDVWNSGFSIDSVPADGSYNVVSILPLAIALSVTRSISPRIFPPAVSASPGH